MDALYISIIALLLIIFICPKLLKPDDQDKSPIFINPSTLKEYKDIKIKKTMKIIDVFIYNNECEILALRLFRLYPFVDNFYIISSDNTFSNNKQSVSIDQCENLIKEYKDKITFKKYKLAYENSSVKKYMDLRRKTMDVINELNLSENDLIIMSDVDEIPTREALQYVIKNPPEKYYSLCGPHYIFNYASKTGDSCSGVIFINKNHKDPVDYRSAATDNKNKLPVTISQTHCSYCLKNPEQIINKIKFLSKNLDEAEKKYTKEYLYCLIENKKDLDNNYFSQVDYDWSINPIPNRKEFEYLTKQNSIEFSKEISKKTSCDDI